MSSRSKDEASDTDRSGPPPSVGILFVSGFLGFFYSLIALVDPLL